MSDLYVWPWRLLRGQSEKAQLLGRVITGGASLSGQVQAVATGGGGYWRLDLTGIDLRTPDAIRCARAWSAYLDGGAQPVIVPFFDLGQAPRPIVGGALGVGSSPVQPADYFAQDPGFAAPLMVMRVAADAALRATSVTIASTNAPWLKGGEHLSINHVTKGWRLYRVGPVAAPADGKQVIAIRPPLREATAALTPLELDVPRCTMTLDPAKAADLEPDISLNRFATVSAGFVESF